MTDKEKLKKIIEICKEQKAGTYGVFAALRDILMVAKERAAPVQQTTSGNTPAHEALRQAVVNVFHCDYETYLKVLKIFEDRLNAEKK